jgi:hypothetical protein
MQTAKVTSQDGGNTAMKLQSRNFGSVDAWIAPLEIPGRFSPPWPSAAKSTHQ